jgi:hypothetical protein
MKLSLPGVLHGSKTIKQMPSSSYGSAELPSIWLAVLLESVNRHAKKLATFRGVDESTPSLDIASLVAYNGSPYISPGNLERLSQAESRTRLAVQQQAQQPEVQEVLAAGGEAQPQ